MDCQQLARILSCLTRCVISAQEILNTVWYMFALYTAKRVWQMAKLHYWLNSMISLKLDIMLEEEE